MNLIETRRENHEDIIKGRFIRKVLTETSQDIDKAQREKMSSFRSGFWKNRTFTVTDTNMIYSHLKQHRFVDMRSRKTKEGKKKKKSHPIHNRIIMGHYNNIVKEMKFGFTDAVKEELRKMENP
jgi:DNA-binding cell septation regulator SpoVG